MLMRQPCIRCGSETGTIEERNGQDCVYCDGCEAWQYNAPRTETGRAVRTVSTTHEAVRPAQRARILVRATGRCELCGNARDGLTVAHLLSVLDGHAEGLTDTDINSDDNLAAMCTECNLGMGRTSAPPRLLAALLRRRISNG